MLNLIIFGPPGAGKGTQSEKLLSKYNLQHISTGDLLRAERSAGTELGNQANEYIAKGELVPDAVVIGMVKNFMIAHPEAKGFIFDGFPRTSAQAEALDAFLASIGTEIKCMLALEVPEEELRVRLLKRAETSGRTDDADPAIIQKRIDEYNQKTAPVKHFYEGQGKYQGINGVGAIEEIFSALCSAIEG